MTGQGDGAAGGGKGLRIWRWGRKETPPWLRNWGRDFCALIPPGAPVRFKPTSALLPEMLRCFRNGSPKKCHVCKRLLSLNLPLGIILMPLFCYPTSKIYIIFILPLLSIYFYFIAYHVGDIWLLNVWRIGPGCCFFLFFLS